MVKICLTFNYAGMEELSHSQLKEFDETSSLARMVKFLTNQGKKRIHFEIKHLGGKARF